jgi:ribonucleoside-triphosphate reductase
MAKQDFKLSETFIEKYKSIEPKFGYNGLGKFVFMRTYSRIKSDEKNEAWWETIRRVVEGIFTIQKRHIESYNLGWNQAKAHKSAQEMYDRIFNFKFLASGRALWSLGTPLTMEKGLFESLYNCSYISSKNIKENPGKFFGKIMDFLMCGVGVGTCTTGKNTITIKQPKSEVEVSVIPDSREGWVESLSLLINSFFGYDNYSFDYSLIRPAGEPIKTFGGTASGSGPLKELHNKISEILTKDIGKPISERVIADITNLIGKCVIAGNVRRSAEIIFGDGSEEFLDLKDYTKNPEREEWGWASNNSIYGKLGMDYAEIAKRIKIQAEPGLYWIENARRYGRVREDESNYKDHRVEGANPCNEITLEDNELCNLVELIPTNHESLEDFLTTIKYAYMFAKTITLTNTSWNDTNRVMLRNRRIGLSMTGLSQFVAERGLNTLKEWMESGYETTKKYDDIYSDWFAVPKSIKYTTVKPSGSLSLLAGVTPGVHYPESNYYIRRVRVGKDSQFVEPLINSGYKVEPAKGQENSTLVVEFPISIGDKIRTLKDVSMWEQLNFTSFCQKYWSDNAVSSTITFRKSEEKDIENALNMFQYQLKGISFLPEIEGGAYAQMPYEAITREQYEEMASKLSPLDFSNLYSEAFGEKYCSNDSCSIL